MSTVYAVAISLNGTTYERTVEPRLLLADFLRHTLGLTGTHIGCEHGVCGACTVMLDGNSIRSCLMFAVQAHGSRVETVESLGSTDRLSRSKRRFANITRYSADSVRDRDRCAEEIPAEDRRRDPGGAVGQSWPLHRLRAHHQSGHGLT